MMYPAGSAATDTVNHWRCRFLCQEKPDNPDEAIAALVARVGAAASWMHIEKLMRFDGVPAYTRAQGEA